MNDFKGTPGPWFIGDSRRDLINVKHSSNRPGAMSLNLAHVVARQSWLEEAKANAQLIAAAPELLELAIYIRNCIKKDGVYQPLDIAEHDRIIAKALGETK